MKVFETTSFEDLPARSQLSPNETLTFLDYPAYFRLLNLPLPSNYEAIMEQLEADEIVVHSDDGAWTITALGSLLLANDLTTFRSLRRKTVRIIVYEGSNKLSTIREIEMNQGYAVGFEALIATIDNVLPRSEEIGAALRASVPVYPILAIRELVANALIHQDLTVTGAGPMVEIFNNRMEITNPGEPLIDPIRFLDSPPRSRNEALAALMRRMGICEERGSGVDKVVFQTEFYQLPAPAFTAHSGSTQAVLFQGRPLSEMDKDNRVRACYLHACLKWVSHEFMTNTSIRERFRIEEKNSSIASRLIKEAVEAQFVKANDAGAAKKLMRYVPFWA